MRLAACGIFILHITYPDHNSTISISQQRQSKSNKSARWIFHTGKEGRTQPTSERSEPLLSCMSFLAHAIASVALAQNNPLTGTWELTGWSVMNGTEVVQQPFGAHPVGLLIYTAGGAMSGHMMADGRSKTEPATPEDFKAAFLSDISYCGKYDFSLADKTVTHHVSASLYPNWVGTDQVRGFNLTTDGKLTLSTTEALPPGLVSELRWKKQV